MNFPFCTLSPFCTVQLQQPVLEVLLKRWDRFMDSDDLKLMCWTLAFSSLYANHDVALAYLSRAAPIAFANTQATPPIDGDEQKQTVLTGVTTISNGGSAVSAQPLGSGENAAQQQVSESYLAVLARIMISEFESFEGYVFSVGNMLVCTVFS